jgi:lipopolysaccharide export system protein LptA
VGYPERLSLRSEALYFLFGNSLNGCSMIVNVGKDVFNAHSCTSYKDSLEARLRG